MEGFIIAAVVVAWFASAMLCFVRATSSNHSSAWILSGAMLLILGFGFVIQASIDANDSGPCLAYEERSVYDPALKITRKADFCVERGVWKE